MKILSMDEFENYKKIKLDKKGLSKNQKIKKSKRYRKSF